MSESINEWDLAEIMSRRCLKIIKYLYNNYYATLRMINLKLYIRSDYVRKCVEVMSRYGIVKVMRIGRAYVIMLNQEGKITKAVIEFLRNVGYL